MRHDLLPPIIEQEVHKKWRDIINNQEGDWLIEIERLKLLLIQDMSKTNVKSQTKPESNHQFFKRMTKTKNKKFVKKVLSKRKSKKRSCFAEMTRRLDRYDSRMLQRPVSDYWNGQQSDSDSDDDVPIAERLGLANSNHVKSLLK